MAFVDWPASYIRKFIQNSITSIETILNDVKYRFYVSIDQGMKDYSDQHLTSFICYFRDLPSSLHVFTARIT